MRKIVRKCNECRGVGKIVDENWVSDGCELLQCLVTDFSKALNESKDAELKRQYLNLCKIHPAPIAPNDLWVLETEGDLSFDDGKVSFRQIVELKYGKLPTSATSIDTCPDPV